MKKTKIFLLCSLLSALILEILPYGAVCNFATPEKTIRKTYSYFDLLPFGYANFAPLITALLTCVLTALGILYLFCHKRSIGGALSVLSVFTFLVSLTPMLFGIRYFSVVGACISSVLAVAFVLSLRAAKYF